MFAGEEKVTHEAPADLDLLPLVARARNIFGQDYFHRPAKRWRC